MRAGDHVSQAHKDRTRGCFLLLRRLLDMGTGSGILSIAALLLGAREAVGVDILRASSASSMRSMWAIWGTASTMSE